MNAPVSPRDDLRALEGYHSPQLDVAVRLNTNESPFPPPPAFVERWIAELRERAAQPVPGPRSPRRCATALGAHLGQPVERLFCANGSNEVLQTLLLTYGGPGRRAAMFEPTYALHSHIARITGTEVVVGERRADFSIDPDAARDLVGQHAPTIVFVCSPNNPTGTVEPAATVEAPARRDRRSRGRRRGLRRVRAAQRARARARRPPARRRAHVLEGVVDGRAAARASRWRRRGSSRSSRRWCCRTTSRRPPRSRDGSRWSSAPRWTIACDRLVAERERVAAQLAARRRHHRVPVGRELRAVPGARRRPRALGAAGRAGRARARLLAAGRASTIACASPSARPKRTTRSSPRSASRSRRWRA